MSARFVYKILDASIWHSASASGHFTGAGIDLNDGFIHLSTAEQVTGTANLFFRDAKEKLVVLEVDTHKLTDPSQLKYEQAGENQFPHLYAPLPCAAVTRVLDLTPTADGTYYFAA